MTSTFTPNKNIEKPAFNDYVDGWDVPVNSDFTIIDTALEWTLAKHWGPRAIANPMRECTFFAGHISCRRSDERNGDLVVAFGKCAHDNINDG